MLFSKRDLFKIILPLIIQQVLAVTIGAVDTMMVSYAGEAAVSGVSLVNTLDVLLVLAFTSLVSGGSVVVAQALGRKDSSGACDAAKQLFWAAGGIAVLLTALVLIFRRPLLGLLFGQVEAEVMASAEAYFLFVAISFPFLAVESANAALFRVMGNSFVSMLVSLGMNLINVAGNAVLILGLGMGAAGAAIATLFSRIVGAAVLTLLIHNPRHSVHIAQLLHYKPDWSIIRAILHIGVPNGIESGMFQFGKLLTQTLISSMGTGAIAANAVANSLANFQYMAGSAYQSTMVTVVGRCIGAGETAQAKRYSRLLVVLNYLTLWVVVLLTFIFARPVIGIYDLNPASAELAHELIVYHAIVAAIIWPVAFTLPSAFRAASDVHFPLVVSMFSMWIFRVALGYYFSLESLNILGFTFAGLGMGVMGVWVSMTVDWLFRTALFLARYFSGRWMTKARPA